MKAAIRRIQQLAIGTIAVFSFAASSIAACTCSHHVAEKAEREKSCHSHSTSDKHGTPPAFAEHRGQSISGTGCSCTQASPRPPLKQDKKHLKFKPVIASSPLAEPLATVAIVSVSIENFDTTPLSQSYLRNSIKGRAPPRPKFA